MSFNQKIYIQDICLITASHYICNLHRDDFYLFGDSDSRIEYQGPSKSKVDTNEHIPDLYKSWRSSKTFNLQIHTLFKAITKNIGQPR